MSSNSHFREVTKMVREPDERFSGTFLATFVNALEFGFACLGVLTLVLVFMGRIAYVG